METSALITRLRRLGMEPTDVEIKAAGGGLPSSIVDTISAFANGMGGTILLGIDEGSNFAPIVGFDADRIRDALADACSNKVDPPCRAPIEIEEFEQAVVVRLDVPELDPVEKPCHIKARGHYGGSFIRGGDGDRRLTHYEVTQMLANRSQPVHDRELVDGASIEDLDAELLRSYLSRIRADSPAMRTLADERLLVRLGVLGRDVDGSLRPTIGGLLSLGEYPQEFFPQLFVSFVVLPSPRMGEMSPDGRRFLDNKALRGPIPTIVADAISMAIRNMRVGAIIQGAGREDRYDYPLAVVRELVTNALMHRDYSPDARGSQIQIELYPDRLVVKSTGGLYGPITVADLGADDKASTSRNQTLAAILADVALPAARGETVCENRGSGLLSVMAELRRVGMSPPEFDVGPGHVRVTVPQHALLSPEVVDWIGSLLEVGLSDAQHLAIAMMRSSGYVTNSMLQAWGVDRQSAGQALRDLVERGLAARSGGRRYATYRLLKVSEDDPRLQLPIADVGETADHTHPTVGTEAELAAVTQAIRAGHGSIRDLRRQLGLSERTVYRRVRTLVERAIIEPTEPRQSRRQSYRLTTTEEN